MITVPIIGYYSGVGTYCAQIHSVIYPPGHLVIHPDEDILFALWEYFLLSLALEIGQLNKRIPNDVQGLLDLVLCYHQRRG